MTTAVLSKLVTKGVVLQMRNGLCVLVSALCLLAHAEARGICQSDPEGRCAGDNDGDDTVDVAELVQGVNAALNSCANAPCQTQSASGGARAYAAVRMNGSLDTSRTRNIDAVEQCMVSTDGCYCVVPAAGIDTATTVAVATIDGAQIVGVPYTPVITVRRGDGTNCLDSAWEVATARIRATATSESGAAVYENIGFFLVVP